MVLMWSAVNDAFGRPPHPALRATFSRNVEEGP